MNLRNFLDMLIDTPYKIKKQNGVTIVQISNTVAGSLWYFDKDDRFIQVDHFKEMK